MSRRTVVCVCVHHAVILNHVSFRGVQFLWLGRIVVVLSVTVTAQPDAAL